MGFITVGLFAIVVGMMLLDVKIRASVAALNAADPDV
jgi:hypothetical protein